MNLMIMLIGMMLCEWRPESFRAVGFEADQAGERSPLWVDRLR